MKCKICQIEEANKTNSHQFPSFLAKIIKFNSNYKRDTELMFYFDKYKTNIYAREHSQINGMTCLIASRIMKD